MKLKYILENIQADSLIIYNKYNLRYFTGFTGTTGVAFITKNNKYFLTDFRYIEQAQNEVVPKGFKIINSGNAVLLEIKNIVVKEKIKSIAIEDKGITVSYFNNLKNKINNVKFIFLKNVLEKVRIKKTKLEIDIVRKAANIADIAFKEIKKIIRQGITENSVAAELEYIMRKNGASDKSFETIVASGYRSAMPHGIASEKIINNNEFVKMDFGCYYNGYVSDMTRTIFVGNHITEKHKEVYQVVHDAQLLALDKVKEGVSCKELDKIARDYITKYGYGDNFGHGLGHGIGLEIHEAPAVNSRNDLVLEENMIITIEPGIYIEGFGGVRIEDDVVVKKNGCEVLTKSSKSLFIIK